MERILWSCFSWWCSPSFKGCARLLIWPLNISGYALIANVAVLNISDWKVSLTYYTCTTKGQQSIYMLPSTSVWGRTSYTLLLKSTQTVLYLFIYRLQLCVLFILGCMWLFICWPSGDRSEQKSGPSSRKRVQQTLKINWLTLAALCFVLDHSTLTMIPG